MSSSDKALKAALASIPAVQEMLAEREREVTERMMAHVNKAIAGAQNGKAAPVKRRPGRPRKNPAPETAAAADKPKKKAKAKRQITDEVRKKLAENLRKARAARAQKVKPVTAKKRGPGRPRKSESEAPAVSAEQA